MKVVHVYKDYDPPIHGGMERHIALLCHFQKQWCDVEALVCSRGVLTQRLEHEGVPITAVGEWGRFQSAPFAPLFPWYMKRCRADVMVLHSPNPTAELGWLISRPRGALIVRYQSDVVRQAAAMRFYAPFLMRLLGKAAMILPTSPQYLESSAVLTRFSDKCRIVPLGIVAEDYNNVDPDMVAGLRSRYGGPYVFFCGVHRYYKGLSWLIRAATGINARVVIAGEGPERAANMALAAQSGADIAFPGALTHAELVAHLHGSAVVAFPSCERSEAFGLSILEAHACGRPVVATRLGTGVEYVNEDGKTGLNVPPRNAEALAEGINRLLADAAMRESMGAYAWARVRTAFSAEALARTEYELYAQVLAR
ncbi:MAG TPA: glycosyltransferase [Candidatus Hydrogenedentes bacterium]|nr:glycosyltransferase [Candidatus Hydrogenedentota bacterium]